MLVLSRHVGQKVLIGEDITITILSVRGGLIRLGFDAPQQLKIHRQEVYEDIQKHGAKTKHPETI